LVEDIALLVSFLIWIHVLPFLAHLAMQNRFDRALDGGSSWADGRPLLGSHKTIRGIMASLVGAASVAPLVGVTYSTAAAAGALGMLGDLLTSFLKRRLGRPAGYPMFGLDQALEGALPLILLVPARDTGISAGIAALALFVPVSHVGSLFLRSALSRPPTADYPRIIRAPTRIREWRACHVPSARWHHWFNFENYFYYRVVIDRFFRAIGHYQQGVANVLAVRVHERTLYLSDLPGGFEGFRVLLLTDLHLDGLEPLTEVLIDRVRGVDVDLCLIGGDVRMELYGPISPSLRRLRRLVEHINARHGIFGVLGNHDCIEMLPDLEQAGVRMLVNETQELRRNGDSLWLVGIDDPHFYRCDDLEYACRDIPPGGFRVLLAHSPEVYRSAVAHGIGLYLCGHTHGGQICLPRLGPLFTHSSAPRYTASGLWRYRGMTGYTSRGAGASGVPLRFNCPGEIPLLTLRRPT
jgi:predicted MPP superfamily phosphohydrolase